MTYSRLFFNGNLSENLSSNLDKSQSHYITKVMRIKEGENFSLFNNSGEWQARVEEIKKNIVKFKIIKKLKKAENDNEIWLAFTPIKLNYFNFMIQKATELGVTKFIPILTDRTIVREINKERISKIIIEASEQSNRIKLPKLEKLIKFKEFLQLYKDINIIFGDINSSNDQLKIVFKNPLCVLIGPEGDFSEKERESILNLKNAKPIKINKNILRTETAAISLISLISFKMLS
ncbi:MAG: 16S rRNA (uracil(1498)-N(3))-methyltransferase [Candidatus Pelagibacter sp. TMED118]|nr:MAG: 16S rRNA (uracil(1498)-N(3))-methyltransferase [Candidatus Pelagibacter sp. TMED118]|tara:strand:+ start:784 stop:1485 length:702 start_codon:yes stop_codon:yes gene_type:complete